MSQPLWSVQISCLRFGFEDRLMIYWPWFTNSKLEMYGLLKISLQPACENTRLCKKIPDTWPSQTEIFCVNFSKLRPTSSPSVATSLSLSPSIFLQQVLSIHDSILNLLCTDYIEYITWVNADKYTQILPWVYSSKYHQKSPDLQNFIRCLWNYCQCGNCFLGTYYLYGT